MNLTVFLDMDGVVASLATTIWDLIDPKNEKAQGLDRTIFPTEFDPKYSLDEVWGAVAKEGKDFHTKIPPFWFSKELVETCQRHADVAFLTSPGNLKTFSTQAACAAYGKHLWVNKYFKDVPLVVTRDKYLCSFPGTLLVDDTLTMCETFVKKGKGGKAFNWPRASRIINGEAFQENLAKLVSELE